MIEIKENLAPTGYKCRSGEKRTDFIGITVHNTANYNKRANAINHSIYLHNDGKDETVSWHYVIDDKRAVRCIPEDEVAWGAGNHDGNYKTINIEICVNSDGNLLQATNNAVILCADILFRNNKRNASECLFQHNHWTDKNCPAEIRKNNPYSWHTFVKNVQNLLKKYYNY